MIVYDGIDNRKHPFHLKKRNAYMVTILNRAKLIADSSSETAAKTREALKHAGIPYYMKTVQNHTALGKAIHSSVGVGAYRGGMPASSFSDQISYVYMIYVSRKDLERAKEICKNL